MEDIIRRAQNEATCIALNKLLDLKDAELVELKAKLAALEKLLQAHQTRGNTTEARRENR